MRVLIVLTSDNPEVRWNAVRFGNFLLNEDEDVDIFLNGPAVRLSAGDSERFPVLEQAKIFSLSGGRLFA